MYDIASKRVGAKRVSALARTAGLAPYLKVLTLATGLLLIWISLRAI